MSSSSSASVSTRKKIPKLPRIPLRSKPFGGSSPRTRKPRSTDGLEGNRRGSWFMREQMPSAKALSALLEEEKEEKEEEKGRSEEEESTEEEEEESSSSSETEKELCESCQIQLVLDALFCHRCGKQAGFSPQKELENQVADAFLRCKEEEEEIRTSSSPQEGYVIKRAFLYSTGAPDTLWYCHATDSCFTGIKQSDKYVAFLQVWKGYVKHKGGKPWPIMENWYGVKDSRGIRKCFFNPVNQTVTIDVSRTVKYLEGPIGTFSSSSSSSSSSLPHPPGTRPPKFKTALLVPMIVEGFYIAREGGITVENASAVGREITMMSSNRYQTESDWEKALGGTRVMRVGKDQKYYAVSLSAVDETEDLSPIDHVAVL